jgi:hypothetical protein
MVLPSLLSCGEQVCSPHCERTDYQGLRLGLVHKSENEGNYALSHRKRRLDDIGFPIDAGGFSGACGKHHLQQRLQYLLQSFAAVLAGGLRIEAGYAAAAAGSTLKFHGSS